jgi:hypothetical protein
MRLPEDPGPWDDDEDAECLEEDLEDFDEDVDPLVEDELLAEDEEVPVELLLEDLGVAAGAGAGKC